MHSHPDQKIYSITCHDDAHVCAHLLRCVNSVFVISSITARCAILWGTTRRLRLHTDGSCLFQQEERQTGMSVKHSLLLKNIISEKCVRHNQIDIYRKLPKGLTSTWVLKSITMMIAVFSCFSKRGDCYIANNTYAWILSLHAWLQIFKEVFKGSYEILADGLQPATVDYPMNSSPRAKRNNSKCCVRQVNTFSRNYCVREQNLAALHGFNFKYAFTNRYRSCVLDYAATFSVPRQKHKEHCQHCLS